MESHLIEEDPDFTKPMREYDLKQMEYEKEQEKTEEEEEQFTVNFDLDEDKIPQGAKVLLCNPGSAQALTKIIFDGKLTEVAKAEATKKEKTTTCLTVFSAPNDFLIIHIESGMSSSYCTPIMEKLSSVFKKNC